MLFSRGGGKKGKDFSSKVHPANWGEERGKATFCVEGEKKGGRGGGGGGKKGSFPLLYREGRGKGQIRGIIPFFFPFFFCSHAQGKKE